jgi:hypothetical protein
MSLYGRSVPQSVIPVIPDYPITADLVDISETGGAKAPPSKNFKIPSKRSLLSPLLFYMLRSNI